MNDIPDLKSSEVWFYYVIDQSRTGRCSLSKTHNQKQDNNIYAQIFYSSLMDYTSIILIVLSWLNLHVSAFNFIVAWE